MLGGTASLPAGDGSWAEVMVEWHPVIATAASAAASRGSWIRRGHFIGSGILAPAVGLNLNPSSPGRNLLPERSEEHTSELQSLMRISYAVFCLKKKKQHMS